MIKAYAAFTPKDKLQPYEYDPGELKSNEVEINVEYCGICHSDVSIIDNEWGNAKFPVVAGHEVVGTINKVGDNVKHLTAGQNVGLGWHSNYCHQCASCTDGDHNLCTKAERTIVGHHGGFADKVRADASSVIVIPEGIELESAGPLFCGGITVFNTLLDYDIKPTSKVAVIGIGGLGHMALNFLNAWGCEVTAFTSTEGKREEALSLGAHHTINSKDKDSIKKASRSFDLIISTVNVPLNWNLFINTLKPRGRLHFAGAITAPLDISVFSLMGAQRQVSSAPVGSPSAIVTMLEFARLHNIKPTIEKYPFSDINNALDRVRSGKAHYRVVLHR